MHVIVVGAGIMGLTTAWQLIKLGHRVSLLEMAAQIPNPLAASGDHHRMIRRPYGGLTGYAALIDEAFSAWDELWADLGVAHYEAIGILAICQAHGDEAERFRKGLDSASTPYRRLEAGAAAERYPFVDASTIRYAFHTSEGGALMCRDIATGLHRWLEDNGAEIRCNAKVAAIDTNRAVVTLAGRDDCGEARGETIVADEIVVTAGAWLPQLVVSMRDELHVMRTTVAYLAPPKEFSEAWSRAPAILSIGGEVRGYVLPPLRGAGLKFGATVVRRGTSNADADRTAALSEGEHLRDLFAPPFACIADYRVTEAATCAYAFTGDSRFTARRIHRITAVSACSGHGYKFGAAVGRRVARAIHDRDESELLAFLRAESGVRPLIGAKSG